MSIVRMMLRDSKLYRVPSGQLRQLPRLCYTERKASPLDPVQKMKRPLERSPRAGSGKLENWARLREPRGPVPARRPRGTSFLPTSSAGPLIPGLLQRPLLHRDPLPVSGLPPPWAEMAMAGRLPAQTRCPPKSLGVAASARW